MFASGARTAREVLSTVTAVGLVTAKGEPLSTQAFNNMLRNPAYAGRIVAPKWGEEHSGDFEAIVPDATSSVDTQNGHFE